jgi:hypothetical protein
MKRDIDALLRERGLAAALILKGETPNPTFRYLVGPPAAHITSAILIWRAGQKPHLVHAMMERDSAGETGFELSKFGGHGFRKILEDEGSRERAMARLLSKLLSGMGVKGPVLVHGFGEVGRYYHLLNRLREWTPGIEIAEDEDLGLFDRARATKEPEEVDAVRSVATACGQAYEKVREMIGGGRLEGSKLKDAQGWVTIGHAPRNPAGLLRCEPRGAAGNIMRWARRRRSAQRGNDHDVLVEGHPIVIDLYPRRRAALLLRRHPHDLRGPGFAGT